MVFSSVGKYRALDSSCCIKSLSRKIRCEFNTVVSSSYHWVLNYCISGVLNIFVCLLKLINNFLFFKFVSVLFTTLVWFEVDSCRLNIRFDIEIENDIYIWTSWLKESHYTWIGFEISVLFSASIKVIFKVYLFLAAYFIPTFCGVITLVCYKLLDWKHGATFSSL